MKYSIETTEKGCIERLEIAGKKLELETIRTDFGSRRLGKCFTDQLEEMVDLCQDFGHKKLNYSLPT